MKYQSKKDPNVYATVDSYDEKYKTTILVYETGEKAGKSVNVSASTLKRWWRKVEDENVLNIDFEQVNEPYPEPKEQKYIPKPQAVIEYEEKKLKKRYNGELPSFEQIVDMFGGKLKKVNETSSYIKFNDESTMWRKSTCIDIYASETTWVKLTEAGFQSKPNKDKVRPYAIKILSKEEFDRMAEVLK